MDQQDKEKTAFSTGNGLMHLNDCNLERLMETILRGNVESLVYLDDIIIEEIFKKFRGQT